MQQTKYVSLVAGCYGSRSFSKLSDIKENDIHFILHSSAHVFEHEFPQFLKKFCNCDKIGTINTRFDFAGPIATR